MGPVSAVVEIDAERARAFDFIRDLANRPAFTDHFLGDFRLLRSESAGVGAGARFRIAGAPPLRWMDTNVVEEDGPHRLLERGNGGRSNRIPVATAWELTPGPGPLITVRLTFWTEPRHPIDGQRERLGAASARSGRNWTTALRRLRDLLESDSPVVERVAVAGGPRYPTDL
jgi:Polyketide cyclase / dehydrase and lipid transport